MIIYVVIQLGNVLVSTSLTDSDYKESWPMLFQKHFLLGTLLEVGGCTRPGDGVDGPDVMLVDQAKATLLQLEADVDIADICQQRYNVLRYSRHRNQRSEM